MARASLLMLFIACGLTLATSSADARDMSGRFGLGGSFDLDPLTLPDDDDSFNDVRSALSARYWVSDLGLEALFGFDISHSKGGLEGYAEWRPALRVLYAMTRTNLTNLYFGVGLSSRLRRSATSGGNAVYFDALLGADFYLSDNLSVGGHLTFKVELGDSPSQRLDTAHWGANFHYYF